MCLCACVRRFFCLKVFVYAHRGVCVCVCLNKCVGFCVLLCLCFCVFV